MSEETFNKTQLSGNPYRSYVVNQKMDLDIKIPEERTTIKITTEQDIPTYGKDLSDAKKIHQLANHQSMESYKRQLIKQVKDFIWNLTPEDIEMTLSDEPTITLMSDKMYDEIERYHERRDRL